MSTPSTHFCFRRNLPRRSFLKGLGVSLTLPWLDAMTPAFARAEESQPPRRFVSVSLALGLHAPNLFPQESGLGYQPTPYLSTMPDLLNDLTVVSGVSHPGVTGGHQAEAVILSAAPMSRSGAFRNTISLDQLMAKHLGHHTRYPSLVLNIDSNNSPSYTENGSMIPAEQSPARLFSQLFLADSAAKKQQQLKRLGQGKSIMDVVGQDAKRLQAELGSADRERLEQYFSSVRELEKRLVASRDWIDRPKPQVDMAPPVDITDRNAVIARKRLMLDIMHLALQTDSTRFITLHLNGSGGVIPLNGVREGYHQLSHHGLDDEKLEQLTLVETELVRAWGDFVRKLKNSSEAGGSVLDRTMVLMTSNLGNASAHDNRNMPVLFAGGGFKHGKHLAFDRKNNYPLPNLYLSALHRLGLELDSFSTGKSEMDGLEMTS